LAVRQGLGNLWKLGPLQPNGTEFSHHNTVWVARQEAPTSHTHCAPPPCPAHSLHTSPVPRANWRAGRARAARSSNNSTGRQPMHRAVLSHACGYSRTGLVAQHSHSQVHNESFTAAATGRAAEIGMLPMAICCRGPQRRGFQNQSAPKRANTAMGRCAHRVQVS
jgi:hypothetical protein